MIRAKTPANRPRGGAAEGARAVYGDATHPETLKEAGVDRAASLILSSSQVTGGSGVIRAAKELNPEVRVLARSAYVRELHGLQKAGSEVVVSGEGEVALAQDSAALLDRLDLLLTGRQLGTNVRDTIRAAMEDVPIIAASTTAERLRRVQIGVTLILATTDYLIQQ